MSNHDRPLGMRPGADPKRIEKYAYRSVAPRAGLSSEEVNRILAKSKVSELPGWHWQHDQGWVEGSCVGHATAMERAITELAQNRMLRMRPFTRRFDPISTWRMAKARDEWAETLEGDDQGTSANAAYSVLQEFGPRRIDKMVMGPDGRPRANKFLSEHTLKWGVSEYRWATTVDEMRHAIASGVKAIAIGTPWMSGFDNPIPYSGEFGKVEHKLPLPGKLGSNRGYHETCVYGASDARQAFRVKNSWGADYPLVWLPYETMRWCFEEDWADACLVTDR